MLKKWPFKLLCKRREKQKGAAALEFAITGPLALAMIFAIMETGMICTRQSLLDNALSNAARFVYTGAALEQNLTQADLEGFICSKLTGMFLDCENNISIEVTEIAGLADIPNTTATCRDASEDIAPVVSYDPKGGGRIMYVRACVTTNILMPGLGLWMGMTKNNNDRYELTASTTFMNEPF